MMIIAIGELENDPHAWIDKSQKEPIGITRHYRLVAVMLGVDIYATVVVAEVDRTEMEKYFDQAEYWLKSWTAPVVRVFTFGFINPRQMVAVEVRNALEEATRLLNSTLWWVSAQVTLRIAYGLSLWLTYAITKN